MFPYFGHPTADPSFVNGGFGLTFFYQVHHWPFAAGGYLPGHRRLSPVQVCPGGTVYRGAFRGSFVEFTSSMPSSYIYSSGYWMSAALITDPRLWSSDRTGNDPLLRRAVRVDEVLHPSNKGMLVEPYVSHLGIEDVGAPASISIFSPEGRGRSYTTIMVDQSGARIPYVNFRPGRRVSGDEGAPVLNTVDGAHGVDLR